MTLRQRTLAPLCALGFLIALAPSAARAQSEVVDPREPVYQEGPLTAAIGDISLTELAQTPPGVSRRFRATIPGTEREQATQLACTAISVLDHG